MISLSKIRNKNILITGITGFIGLNLSKKLKEMGANVFGISRTSQVDNIYKINLDDFDSLDDFIKAKKISICFHLAGESLVESGYEDPLNTFKTNITKTLNVLESARKNHLDKIIISSTAHVYGALSSPCTENDNPRPSRPYETSKLCTDLISQSYANTFGLPIFVPRLVNIYGPGDNNFRRLIPNTIRNILLDKNPQMWGGKAIRDYLFIDDAVNAYVSLALANNSVVQKGIIFNFGSNNIISVEDLILKLIKISKKDLKIINIPFERDNEIAEQFLNFSKAKKLLEWNPTVNIDEGLKRTYKWYEKKAGLFL
ncbi:MAG: NAD(P)-dependent oxidoreductase [Pseudomonadales bacterium]|nr:NAD(P)-dependent oxidoreductase [Pseudomonadales bacterium]